MMPEELSDQTMCFRCGQTEIKNLHKCNQCNSITYCDKVCQREDWGRHKDNCIPVMLTELKGKGRGLVASRDIQVGEVIFTEEAAITWNPPDVGSFHLFLNLSLINHSCAPNSAWSFKASDSNSFKKEYKELAHYLCMGTAVYALLSGWSIFWQILSYIMTLFLKVRVMYLCSAAAVCLMLEDWCFIWKILSFFLINHTYSKLKCRREPKRKLVLRAIQNIHEGEEINLCYLGYFENLGSKYQMKQHLETNFKFDCKCSVCIGDIPHQNLTKEKIRSLQARMTRQRKKNFAGWRRDAMDQNKIIDLTKTLHVGPMRLSREYITLIRIAQMSRDSEILDKALEDFKDVVTIYKLEEMAEKYKEIVSDVKSWSYEFESRFQPDRREYLYFFPCCGNEL